MPYDASKSYFPNAVDAFVSVSNGTTPDNRITAASFNKIQNALLAVEAHAQYTVASANPTGSALLFRYAKFDLATSLPLPGTNLSLEVGLSPDLYGSFAYDGLSPFNRGIAIFASACAYRTNHAFRFSYPVRAAVNVRQENNNSLLTVVCIKASQWLAGDSVELSLVFCRP